MKPIPNTRYHIHDLIRMRWSPRAFTDRAVEQDKINSMFEAARWAPSSMNEQPWSFIYGTKDEGETFGQIVSCLNYRNQLWAREAPVLILTVAFKTLRRNGQVNRVALYDLGQAVMNLIVQATSMDLHVHQMGGFSQDTARQIFNIPENAEPVTVIAVGYHGDVNRLFDDFAATEYNPQVRRDISLFVRTAPFEPETSE